MKRVINDEEFQVALNSPDNQYIIKHVTGGFRDILRQDELENCGLVALWKTLQSHDYSFQTKFTTSLYRYVKWECLAHTRSKPQSAPIEETVFFDKRSDEVDIAELLDHLSDREKNMVRSHYVCGMSLSEIGKEYGMSKEGVRLIILKAMKTLKECCGVSLS